MYISFIQVLLCVLEDSSIVMLADYFSGLLQNEKKKSA